MNTNNLVLVAQKAATLGVGSGDWLDCVNVILIIMLVVEVAMLGMCCKFMCEDYKRYRQCKNRRREYEDAYRKINQPLGLNLGVFGKPNLEGKRRALPLMRIHVQILEVTKNLISRACRKPIMPFIHITRLRNFFGCFSFGEHKSKNAAKPSNEKS
jgi:hypothetical protein